MTGQMGYGSNYRKEIFMDKRQHKFDFDANKICIVINVTAQDKYDITMRSLQTINVPQGKKVEICEIFDAANIGAAYNQAIIGSNAKYKIYIQEGVEILNKNILSELLDLFESEYKAGIVGMSGSEYIPVDTNIYKTKKYYGAICSNKQNIAYKEVDAGAKIVDGLDGLFLATQYDIPWREDKFSSLYYLTLAQCTEFRQNGYSPMVVQQDAPWIGFGTCLEYRGHDDGTESKAFKEMYYKDIFPLVSILIPTHNRPEYLKIALESAINQTYQNLEIIVSDDSDDDRTYQLIQTYLCTDARLKYFYHKGIDSENNCSILLDNTTGEFINWLMDDDAFMHHKIETMIDYYRDNDDVTLVTSSREVIDAEGKTLGVFDLGLADKQLMHGKLVIKRLFQTTKNFIGEPTTFLLKKSYLKQTVKKYYRNSKYNIINRYFIGWDFSTDMLVGMGDMTLALELMTRGNLIFINEPLSKFRFHPGQDQKIKSFFWKCNTAVGFFLACHYCYNLNIIEKNECLSYIESYIEVLNCLIGEGRNDAGEFISNLMRECRRIGLTELQSNSIVDIKAALGLGEK